MAKFCGNCGKPMEDHAKVCGNCGTPLEGGTSSKVKLKIEDSRKKEKFKKKIPVRNELTIGRIFPLSLNFHHHPFPPLLNNLKDFYLLISHHSF